MLKKPQIAVFFVFLHPDFHSISHRFDADQSKSSMQPRRTSTSNLSIFQLRNLQLFQFSNFPIIPSSNFSIQ
ncbi:MAG: hypothetical protein C0433_06530 [Cyclobacterium sp.]|nr:hypothetical protein [Cyclobacterium sp.]